MIKFYQTAVTRYPKITNTITSGLVASIGDAGAQFIERTNNVSNKHDFKRSLKMLVYGSLFTGIPFIYWYKALDKMFGTLPTFATAIKKSITNQVTWSPCITLAFFTYTNTVEYLGDGLETIYRETKNKIYNDFVSTFIRAACVFTIANIINFYSIPPPFRVVFNNSVAAGWTVYLSLVGYKDIIKNKIILN